MHPAPISIGSVTLTVRDLTTVAAFYERIVGLERLAGDASSVTLGAGGKILLKLEQDAHARLATPRDAGLFHTAFLLPQRSDLARWFLHAMRNNVQLQGASDHIVSEAMYLADPEGNGIEIYVDRPAESWVWTNGAVKMSTDRLDIDDLLKSTKSQEWTGAPADTVVGHVHLQVGALEPAEAFYAKALGFDVTTHYPGATFYSTGHYHHHLATNIWNSRAASLRQQPATGLKDLRLSAKADAFTAVAQRNGLDANAGQLALIDPWGTTVTLVRA